MVFRRFRYRLVIVSSFLDLVPRIAEKQYVEGVRHAGVNMKLGRHSGCPKVLRVRDVLVAEDIEFADLDESGRQPVEVPAQVYHLFDAFRNIYLALESLLSEIEKFKLNSNGGPGEGEGIWLNRAIAKAGSYVNLDHYIVNRTTQSASEDLYNELCKQIRNLIFHAKNGPQVLLPQAGADRETVLAAKEQGGRRLLRCRVLQVA